MAEPEDWVAPASAKLVYKHLEGNKFSGLNQDTSGSREERKLPQGPCEFQLYSLNTPNGQKAGIAFEEFGLEYNAHFINILQGDQFTSGFVEMNPNSRIPAMKHIQKSGAVVNVFESGAILLYLADKYKKFIPETLEKRGECYSWLMWQMASQGPMFGQFGHFFRYAPRRKHETINYGVARYAMEVRRLLSVMENHLKNKTWFLGDEYSIVDMACYPWVVCLDKGYGAKTFLQVDTDFPHLMSWCERMEKRPAVQRGMCVCGPPGASKKLAHLISHQQSKI